MEAKKAKERTYRELVASDRCRLLVMGFEVAGRWSSETVAFLHLLAQHKAESSPICLRRSAHLFYFQRWTGMLARAAQRAYAASLLEEPLARSACVNGPPVHLSEMDRLL